MARLKRPARTGAREHLIEVERDLVETYPGLYPTVRLAALLAGKAVTVHGYEVDWPTPLARIRVGCDGSLSEALDV